MVADSKPDDGEGCGSLVAHFPVLAYVFMTASDLRKFLVCVLIWGTTWLAITFQLGLVAPEASVAWRFGLSALVLAGICRWRGDTLRFPWSVHARLFLFGVMMFGIGYLFVYYAEGFVASGLVAVGYCILPLSNQLGAKWMFGTPLSVRVSIGGVIGTLGVGCVFWPELAELGNDRAVLYGALLTAGGVLSTTWGNLLAERLGQDGLNVWQKMTWGMAYGALCCLLVACWRGQALTFSLAPAYLFSLLYLAIFGSVIAFFFYFRLMENVGGGRAGYVGVMTPVVALILSGFFEGFHWTALSLLGLGAAVVGNLFILRPEASGRS